MNGGLRDLNGGFAALKGGFADLNGGFVALNGGLRDLNRRFVAMTRARFEIAPARQRLISQNIMTGRILV